MAKKKNRRTPARVSFPDDERDLPWLTLILKGYHILDRGVTAAISEAERKGVRLACEKGCSTCCATHKDIPLYPLELKCIIWYVTEKIAAPSREILIKQLGSFRKSSACPFLIEGACSIHPVRPMACRQFNVFNRKCEDGEDPYYSRRQDVMEPVKRHVDQAFFIMLPYYGVKKETDRRKAIETGSFHRLAMELHSCNWRALAEKMKKHDKKG